MIEASFKNTTKVFTGLVREVADWKDARSLSNRAFSLRVGIDKGTVPMVLECRTREGGKSPMSSNRLTTILKLRQVLGMNTIIQTRAGKEQYNINLPEERERLYAKVLDWARKTPLSSGELDRIAGLSSGQTAGLLRRPDHYMTLRLAMQAHTKWIEPMDFVTIYEPAV